MDAKAEAAETPTKKWPEVPRLMTWWERFVWCIAALAATSPHFEFGSAIVMRPSDETMKRIEES